MYCDLGQGLGKRGPLVNFSEIVVYIPEYLVLRPGASWLFLKFWWRQCVASQCNRDVRLLSEGQFTSWVFQASDVQNALEANNNFC